MASIEFELARAKRHRVLIQSDLKNCANASAQEAFQTCSPLARLGDIGNSAGINVLTYLLLLCNRCCCLMRGIVLLQACPFFVGLSSSRRARSFMSRSRRASCRSNFASILRIRKSMRHIFQKCTWVDHGSYSNSHSRVMRINYCNQAMSRPGLARIPALEDRRPLLPGQRPKPGLYIYIYIYE